MKRTGSAAMLLSMAVLAAGCKQDARPPANTEPGGVPIVLPEYLFEDQSIIRSAADEANLAAVLPDRSRIRGATGGQGTPAATPGDRITIDDSTPEALVQTYLTMLSSGNVAQLPTITVDDQRDAVGAMVDLLGPAFAAWGNLQAAARNQLPNLPAPRAPEYHQLADWLTPWQLEQLEDVNNNEVVAVLVGSQGGINREQELTLVRVDDAWRVSHPYVPDARSLEDLQDDIDAITQAVEAVATQVAQGNVTTENQLQSAVEAALAGEMPPEPGRDMAAADTGRTGRDERPRRPETRRPAPKREPVDEVYSGPAMLRRSR